MPGRSRALAALRVLHLPDETYPLAISNNLCRDDAPPRRKATTLTYISAARMDALDSRSQNFSHRPLRRSYGGVNSVALIEKKKKNSSKMFLTLRSRLRKVDFRLRNWIQQINVLMEKCVIAATRWKCRRGRVPKSHNSARCRGESWSFAAKVCESAIV